jgi:hypothetical protein
MRLWTFGAGLLFACSGATKGPSTPLDAAAPDAESRVCAPNQSIACTGPGGCSGGQACNADGTAYLPCDCVAGGDGGSGSSSGGSDSGSGDVYDGSSDAESGTGTTDAAAADSGRIEDAASDGGTCLSSPANLVSWWTGDGVYTDHQGTNVGTPVGTVPFVTGEVLEAFQIMPGSWVQIPDSPSLELTSEITIEGWINAQSLGANGRIFDKAPLGTPSSYLFDDYNGNLRLYVGDSLPWLQSAQPIPVGVFTHVAGTYDGTTMRVYINGALSASKAYTGAIATNNLPARIGADSGGGTGFDGVIDELSLYSRALTAAEIGAIYDAGSKGRCK